MTIARLQMVSSRVALLFVCFLLSFPRLTFATDIATFDTVIEFLCSNRFDSAHARIESIRVQNAKDPDYYVLDANYYFRRASEHVLVIKSGEPTSGDTTLLIRDSTDGHIVGYFSDSVELNQDSIRRAIELLQEGTRLYPDRLDMHLGLVYMNETTGRFREMTQALENILARSTDNKQNWSWEHGLPLSEDPVLFIIGNVQSRVNMLFQMGSHEIDSLVSRLSAAMIRYFPDHSYGYANMGSLHVAKGEFQRGLEFLQRAYTIDSMDAINVWNLADVYERMSDTTMAARYYLMVSQIDDTDMKSRSLEKLSNLRSSASPH